MPLTMSRPYKLNLSNYPAEVLADGPYAYWRLDEPAVILSGDTAADSSGNARNGTYQTVGLPVPTGGHPALITNTVNPGTSCEWTAAGEYVQILQTASEYNPANFTVEAWGTVDDLSGGRTVFHNGNAGIGGSRGVFCYVETDGSMTLGGWDTSAGPPAFSSVNSGPGTIIADGRTYHLVFQWSQGNYVRFYRDGALVLQVATTTETWEGGGTQPAVIGAIASGGSNATRWDGYLDEVAFYDYILSAPRIAAHYAAGS